MDWQMQLFRHVLAPDETLTTGFGDHAIYVCSGSLVIDRKTRHAGDGFHVSTKAELTNESNADAGFLQFRVTAKGRLQDEYPASPVIEGDIRLAGKVLLRLDQVTFSPEALAWRHVHAGGGIRYLVDGRLEIHSDHHVAVKAIGDAWFEDIESPVKATPLISDGQTRFVRAMVIPWAYHGRATIRILDPVDAAKPTLQKNLRFFEVPLSDQ